eukprot:3599658-Rhodomonas_salina.1
MSSLSESVQTEFLQAGHNGSNNVVVSFRARLHKLWALCVKVSEGFALHLAFDFAPWAVPDFPCQSCG